MAQRLELYQESPIGSAYNCGHDLANPQVPRRRVSMRPCSSYHRLRWKSCGNNDGRHVPMGDLAPHRRIRTPTADVRGRIFLHQELKILLVLDENL